MYVPVLDDVCDILRQIIYILELHVGGVECVYVCVCRSVAITQVGMGCVREQVSMEMCVCVCERAGQYGMCV